MKKISIIVASALVFAISACISWDSQYLVKSEDGTELIVSGPKQISAYIQADSTVWITSHDDRHRIIAPVNAWSTSQQVRYIKELK